MRILILGATGFIGPHHVRAAVARGHQVSVFVRGKRPVELPAQVEVLVGDRNHDLSALMNRDWDAVIDLSTFGPVWIRTLGEALKGRVKHYTVISSQDSYAYPEGPTMETSEVREFDDPSDPYSEAYVELFQDPLEDLKIAKRTYLNIARAKQMYGSLKVLCGREAERQFPGKTLILRPGFILGAGDPNPAFTYWVERIKRGGEMLVTGDLESPVQIIDVRDVAEWVIRMVEKANTGIYNVVGPEATLSFRDMLESIGKALGSQMTLTWVPTAWLLEAPWWPLAVLFWTSEAGGFDNPSRLVVDKARAQGLTYRRLAETVEAVRAWSDALSAERRGTPTGIQRLAGGERWVYEITRWEEYLAQEKRVLAAWHAARLPASPGRNRRCRRTVD